MILNCLCTQCRMARRRHQEYLAQTRKVRRKVTQQLNYYTSRGIVEFEIPEKYAGVYAA
jgi:hypothetical protein